MKKLIILLLIIAVISIPAYLVLSTKTTQDDFYIQLNEFTSLLNQKEYEQVKLIYEQSSNTLKANYNISLDSYAQTLIEEAKNEDTTQEALDLLYSYEDIGYQSTEIDNAILHYEDLLQSNYIFEKGLEYYNNSDFESAIECFSDVLEYDENYELAQEYINSYQEDTLAWKEAADNNSYGRSPYPNSIAYQDLYIYVPYKFNDSIAILKINTSTYTILSFPIVSNENGAEVSNINIVGEYMFFLIEQNNPSLVDNSTECAVYRMTTSGKDLVKVTDCDYTYLLSYRDEFYAISKSKGIVKMDNHFVEEEVLIESDSEITQMQLVDEGIYYTSRNQDDDLSTVYFYDGETSEKIMQEVNVHYYDYGDDNIIYYDSNAFYEYLYHEDMSAGNANNNQIYAGDMYKYYGKLNDSVIFTFLGDYQQECIRVKDIVKFKTTYKASASEISYVPIGICYDEGVILLKSDSGISITTEDMRIQQTISLPHVNNSVLSENQEKIGLADEDSYFSEEAVTLNDESRWIYSDENVNISTEEVYLDSIESTVYISHIYTKDYKWLEVETIDKLTKPIDADDNIVWAISGQFYNAEPTLINETTGFLNSDVYAYNDDGMFLAYRADNVVSGEKVLSNDIVWVFSQGDIILEEYEITDDCIVSGDLSGRSAIGMVEAGHYVAVVAEKSTKSNRGLSLYSLAKLMQDEGCTSAFSFDYNYGPYFIFEDEYIYDVSIDSEDIRKYNQVLYYAD